MLRTGAMPTKEKGKSHIMVRPVRGALRDGRSWVLDEAKVQSDLC